MRTGMKKYVVAAVMGGVLVCMATAVHAQTLSYFASIPISSTVTFSKFAVDESIVSVSSTVTAGYGMSGADPLNGTIVQFAPLSGTVYANRIGIVSPTKLNLQYGGAGYVMFRDINGGGVGWHIKNYQGWSIVKMNGELGMQVALEAPFWLGDPPANVSPALAQMKTASYATILIPLSTLVRPTPSLKDLCNIGESGTFANQTSVTVSNTLGYMYLSH